MKILTFKSSFLLLYALLFNLVAFSQGNLEGYLYDISIEEDKESLPGTTVKLYNDNASYYDVSDEDGKYEFMNIPQGVYNADVTYFGKTATTEGIKVGSSNTNYVNLDIKAYVGTDVVDIIPYKGLFVVDQPTIQLYEAEDIENGTFNTVADIVKVSTGTTVDASGNVSFRGGRPGEAVYYIDGMRSEGTLNIPLSAIYTLEVLTAGIPARYGETTSGVILVETKSYFNSYR